MKSKQHAWPGAAIQTSEGRSSENNPKGHKLKKQNRVENAESIYRVSPELAWEGEAQRDEMRLEPNLLSQQ